MESDGRELARSGAPLDPPATDTGPGAAFRFYLYPGRLYVAMEDTLVTTILGSCVSVCLWDRRKGIGGMNHYLLPQGSANDSRCESYANVANPRLLDGMLKLGAARRDLQAKLFGGACLSSEPPRSGEVDLGTKNIQAARAFLQSEGIEVASADVAGSRGRKLLYRTSDSAAWVRKL